MFLPLTSSAGRTAGDYASWECFDPHHQDKPADVFDYVQHLGGVVDWTTGRAYPCIQCKNHQWFNFSVMHVMCGDRCRVEVKLHEPPNYAIGSCRCMISDA